mmetsp:Transcript_14188/g.47369  ORF Transcript_14188/g.47369 Transcript_14188/m.47369 type:complete len:210 (-) Transcript_14188:951-1580(-)
MIHRAARVRAVAQNRVAPHHQQVFRANRFEHVRDADEDVLLDAERAREIRGEIRHLEFPRAEHGPLCDDAALQAAADLLPGILDEFGLEIAVPLWTRRHPIAFAHALQPDVVQVHVAVRQQLLARCRKTGHPGLPPGLWDLPRVPGADLRAPALLRCSHAGEAVVFLQVRADDFHVAPVVAHNTAQVQRRLGRLIRGVHRDHLTDVVHG